MTKTLLIQHDRKEARIEFEITSSTRAEELKQIAIDIEYPATGEGFPWV